MSLGIRLTWKRSNDDTVEYGIWRRTYDTEAHEIARIAQTAAGENPFFEDMDVDIKPPIGPDGLTIECPTDSTVRLKWAEAADPANPTYYYSIRSYTADGGHSPFCPEVSLQPPNVIHYYEWALLDEADGDVVASGVVPGDEFETPEIEIEPDAEYRFEVAAYDRAGNAGEKKISEVFTS
jgi:hypothetical protein